MTQDRAIDIHFVPEYASSFERHEGGTVHVFQHQSRLGLASHLFIQRPIGVPGFETYCDILTPYGYGGPRIVHCESGHEAELAEEYRESFESHCKEQKIVCNFTRFHPILRNDLYFASSYDEITALRDIVIVDLTKDVMHEEFRKSARQYLRKYTDQITLEIDRECRRLQDFIDVYYDTMDKNDAKTYYYFDRAYFEWLFRENEGHVCLLHGSYEGQIVASKLLLTEGDYIYYQYAGTRKGCYQYHASPYMLSRSLVNFGKEGRYKYAVLGGGVTNEPDSKILHFKKQYSKSLYKFYTGKRIYDPDTYDKICRTLGVSSAVGRDDFSPAYRER